MFAVASAIALFPAAASAQESSDGADASEIVVTAQRRDERSVDVPISVTTLGNDQLATANVNALSDTAKLTPGLRFDSQGPGVQPTIRGVGTAISTSGAGPNVAIYVDGFFQANANAADLQLMKVKSIQVLKGPQGTLFGRNTTGGAILVTSADPSTETSGEIKLQYGRFNALTAQAYMTTGLSENLAFDIEGLYRRGDGHFTDIIRNDNKIGKYENWSIRAGVKAQLGDNVSLLVRYMHTENNDPTTQLVNIYVDQSGSAGFLDKVSAAGRAFYGVQSSKGLALAASSFPASTYTTVPGQIQLDALTDNHVKIDSIQATLKADLGFADLTSYTQWRKDSAPYHGDLDATAIPAFGILVGIYDKTISQEFLLNSKPGSRLQWTAGLNYFQYKDTWNPVDASFGGAPFIRFGGSGTTTKSYAAFLDATYEVTDRLFITAGARYSHDEVGGAYFITNPFTYTYSGPTGQPVCYDPPGPALPCTAPFPNLTQIPVDTLKNNTVTPRFVIRYKPTLETSIYASYTRGYKAGLLNVGGLSQEPIKPETINAYEAGVKFDNRTFSFEAAGFYYDYKNLQVSSYQSGAAQIRNAASSEIYGLEAQFRYRVSSAFTINGGAAWTHARYKSFPNAPYYTWCDPTPAATPAMSCGFSGAGAIIQTSTDASGFKMQRSPEFSGNLGASYGFDVAEGRATLSGNLYYTSSFYADPEQQFKQNGYALVSLRAQWVDPSERFTVAVYGDNVTNKRYESQVLFTTLGIGNVWAPPATYGVQLGVKF